MSERCPKCDVAANIFSGCTYMKCPMTQQDNNVELVEEINKYIKRVGSFDKNLQVLPILKRCQKALIENNQEKAFLERTICNVEALEGRVHRHIMSYEEAFNEVLQHREQRVRRLVVIRMIKKFLIRLFCLHSYYRDDIKGVWYCVYCGKVSNYE